MNVWIVYEIHEIGEQGMDIDRIFATEDAAIRFVMDRDECLLKIPGWSEDRLRKYAENEIEQHEVLDDY